MTTGEDLANGVASAHQGERRCVLIVHGVGEQRQSDAFLFAGSPLLHWTARWARTFYDRPSAVELGPVELNFGPSDNTIHPSYAVLTLPDQQWHVAEAWWGAHTFGVPKLSTMLTSSFVYMFDVMAQLLRSAAERSTRLIHPRDPIVSTQPSLFWQQIDLWNCIVLSVEWCVGSVLAYAVLIPVMLLTVPPVPWVQDFLLMRIVRPLSSIGILRSLLTAGAGFFRVYLEDDVRAADIRRRVAQTARWLMQQSKCDDLIILAYADGCVVSLDMLADPTYEDIRLRTRKLLTLGSGLNKSWLLKPDVDRIFGPLVGDIQWIDFWSTYDPIPSGPLDPSRRVTPNGRLYLMSDVYKPMGEALRQLQQGSSLVSQQVTNMMNPLSDHSSYFANDEQVLIRLAAEVDSVRHTDSKFWPPQEVLSEHVRRRRIRVAALALWREIAITVWLLLGVLPWLVGWMRSIAPWAPLSVVPPAAIGPSGTIIGVLTYARDDLPTIFTPVAALAGRLLELPAFPGMVLLVGIVTWAVYRFVQWRIWERWDRIARAAFAEACAVSSRSRLDNRHDGRSRDPVLETEPAADKLASEAEETAAR